jgi:HEAT repeat protein
MTAMTMDPEIAALLTALDDPDAEIRRIGVLQAVDAAEEHPHLFARASRDSDAGVRLEAVRALEGDASDEGVNALVDRLDDDDSEVRTVAALSLAEILDEVAGPVLLRRLETAQGQARAAILGGLRKLRLAEAFLPALASLNDPLAAVRREAVGVLGYLRDAGALPALAERVGRDSDAEVRRAAVGALAFGSGDGVLPGLLSGLRDSDWQTREEAAVTLGRLLLAGSAADLIAALNDDYWQVRLKAANALGKLKEERAVAGLIAALSHPIGNLRKEAADALGAIGHRDAIPALTAALEDPDVEVRKVAERALARL